MKNLIFLLASIIILFSCTGTKKGMTVKENKTKYRIKKIDKNNSWYIIYADRNDTLFKIVSFAKNKIDESCRKIVVGGIYDFELKSKKGNAPIIGGVKLDPVGYTGCYVFDKETTICLEPKRGIYDLFFTNDLKGICYLK
jgi:hypothetical protein